MFAFWDCPRKRKETSRDLRQSNFLHTLAMFSLWKKSKNNSILMKKGIYSEMILGRMESIVQEQEDRYDKSSE
jgi:hypothetical protein